MSAQQVKSVPQQVTVTTTRSPLETDASAKSLRTVSAEALRQTPAFTLDDRLRQVPGFELYRRTSSWVANPTTEGISLRGLGSTAASRTLVLTDEVPLNDPFGNWVHWSEVPSPAIERVELVRGGGSDLYGSSAIGGVINAIPVQAGVLRRSAEVSGGPLGTVVGNGILSGALHRYSGLAATEFIHTNGYIQTAPEQRGRVDVPAGVHSETGRIEGRIGDVRRSAFLRGNLLNEARNNGTPVQANSTRLWRYQAGGDAMLGESHVLARLYGSTQHYSQTFSTIAAGRNSESLNKLQKVPSQEIGFAAQWSRGWKYLGLVAGADLRDVRATDVETAYAGGVAGSVTNISARQRASGGFGEALWTQAGWSAALSMRVDDFRTFDGTKYVDTTRTQLTKTDEVVFSPRLGLVRRLPHGVALNGSVFRAFRGPTMNELYRSFQVGQQLTTANDALKSERATGMEFGAEERGRLGSVRATYFWTEVNRPITSLRISQTPTQQKYQRVNLGQIRSHGVSVDVTSNLKPWLQVSGGYQFAVATVTNFAPQPSIIGNWLPEVARNMATAQVRFQHKQWGTVNVVMKQSGRAYDDTENTEMLHSFFRMDVQAEHALGSYVDGYVAAQNLFDRRIEAGITPTLTLATPQVVMVGVRLHSRR